MTILTCLPISVTVVPDAGTIDWSNASNALTENGLFAVASGVAPDHDQPAANTHALKFIFDTSEIPDGATINSWRHRLKRKSSDASGVHYANVSRLEAGAIVHPFQVQPVWGTSLAWETDISTLAMPTASVLKASNSGLIVSVEFYGGDGVSIVDASIDAIESVIDYTAAGEQRSAKLAWQARGVFIPGFQAGEVERLRN